VGLYRDEAVVIRTSRLGEADRIITLLTREHGRIRAVAKGVRRTKSKFGARLEPASTIEVQLHTGKTFDIITEAVSKENFGDELSADYQKWTIASAILETAERFTLNEAEPSKQQYLLVVGALRSLARDEHAPSLILDAFLLRSLAVGGYAPALDSCFRCEKTGPHRFFSLAGGGSVCSDCRPSGSATVSSDALALMSALLSGEWSSADDVEQKVQREASGVVAAYLQFHLERSLRSLPLVERV
jgi:DNA repair protein RecO (recombination protein O)